MLNLILFGPPGAGKGTQASKLLDKYKLIHLSTGDILRSEIAAGTKLGLEAKLLMDKGILVSDEIVVNMIDSKISQNAGANGFIFDGFPRTLAQAEALDNLLQKRNIPINATLALEVSNEELTKRILLRGKSSGRADDQDEATVRKRIEVYTNQTSPLKEYYKKQGKLRTVNGIGEIDSIFKALCNEVDKCAEKV
jgi:adenylate kinase